VFSPIYAESGPVCAVLMAGVSVGVCNFLLGLALIASGRPRAILRAAIPEAVINIAANAILIPRFGLMGAAGASVISRCVANPVFLFQLARSQSWPTAVCYLRSFLNLGIAYTAFWLMSPLGAWAGVLSLGVFAVLTLRFGGLEWDDLTLKNAGSLSAAPVNDLAMAADV
jgi:O-antigen/teichoic acid export membrane protein